MRVTKCGFSPVVAALAASLGLSLTGAHRSAAASNYSVNDGPQLKLLSPAPRTDFRGAHPIEIDALYEGTPGNGIVRLDLYIDGVKAQSQSLNSPEAKGIVSFLVDSSLMTPGTHYVVIRATAADAEVRSVRGEFIYGASSPSHAAIDSTAGDEDALSWPTVPGAAPQMRLIYPSLDSKVQGTVTIRVDANDENNSTPYVSIFIDGEMKQLVNYRPFEYTWDTTTLPNGWHTIAVVEAFNDDSVPVAKLKPIRVYVNNPGGDTYIRTDLLDGAKPYKPALSKPLVIPTHRLPLLRMTAPRKSLVQSPFARRPLGRAWLAPGLSTTLPESHQLLAEANPQWDGITAVLDPALSAPTLPNLPAVQTPARLHSAKAPRLANALPRTHILKPLPANSAQRPMLMAEALSLEKTLTSPVLALPEFPAAAAPHKIMISTPHPGAAPHVQRVMTPMPSIQSLHLRINMPNLPLRAEHVFKPQMMSSSMSLLQAVGQTKVLFNHTNVVLDRPLAVNQDIMFGPLRRLFEYGGGTLQWHAHSGVVQAQTATRDVRLTIGDRHATVNKQAFTMPSAPYVSSGRTMVPLSFLSVALDATVKYDPATGHLKITSLH